VAKAILTRLLHAVPVLWAAASLVWIFMFVIPGDPARLMSGRTQDPRILENVRAEWGLDRPPLERYASWLGRVVRGDLGKSYALRLPVADILRTSFVKTAFLAGAAALLAILAGVLAGALAARHGGWVDRLLTAGALAGVSIPTFWLGLLLILLFASTLRWLPISGYGEGISFLGVRAPQLSHLVLPAMTLAVFPAALISRVTRASVLEQLESDHVRAARARGIAPGMILWRHALPSALAPVTTIAGLVVASLLGGAVATEIVFAWPGLGLAIFDAIERRDLPVVEGAVLLLTTIFLASSLVADIALVLVDPRVRRKG